jgi:cytochrome c-type biogenesis protein CcmF
VHAAIVLLAVGIAGSSAFDSVREAKLKPGQSMRIGDYTLGYRSLDQHQGPNAMEVRANIDVHRGGSDLGVLRAGKNAYAVEQQVSNEVGIRTDWLRLEDLFVIADQINPNGVVYFRVFVKPLVNLIWIAGFVFVLGSAIALWPDAREQRRLVARSYEVGIPATT